MAGGISASLITFRQAFAEQGRAFIDAGEEELRRGAVH